MTVGDQVQIQFGEHWNLVTAAGSGWLRGAVSLITPNRDSALIDLSKPVEYAGQQAAQLIAMPRYVGQSLAPNTESIICGFIAADDSMIARFSNLEPRAMTSWFSAIGTLKVADR